MKFCILLVVFCTGCLTVSAEISKKELKEYSRLIKIDGIECSTQKNRSKKEFELFTIDFSSDEDKSLVGLVARIAVELVDAQTKQTYLFTDQISLTDPSSRSDQYIGEGYFELEIPHGSFEKLKTTAYVFEIGIMDGKTFVPLNTKSKKAKSFEELAGKPSIPLSGNYRLRQVSWVDGR